MFTDAGAMASLIVGVLGFISAILALAFNAINNRKILELNKSIDYKDRQKSYNKVLGHLLKVYHSFMKHRMVFDEKGVKYLNDEVLFKTMEEHESFENDIEIFKTIVHEESEIVPELTFYIHELVELLNRFKAVSEVTNKTIPHEAKGTELERKLVLVIKRAHNYAYEEILDKSFKDLIEVLSVKADVGDNFLTEVKKFNSEAMMTKNTLIRDELAKRMKESYKRQLGDEIDTDELFKS